MFRVQYQQDHGHYFSKRGSKQAAIANAIRKGVSEYLAKLDKTDSRLTEKRVKIDIDQERITISILDEPDNLPMVKSVAMDTLTGTQALEDYAFRRVDIRKSANDIRDDIKEIINKIVAELAPRGDL